MYDPLSKVNAGAIKLLMNESSLLEGLCSQLAPTSKLSDNGDVTRIAI